jgi:hypothetical protein
MPGMPGPAGNPYVGAQKALGTASNTIKYLQIGMAIGGGLFVIGGIITIFTSGIGTALGLIITGVVLVGTAFLFLPQFNKMMGSATSMVDGLAAKSNLAQTGLPASGTIVSATQTGRLINHNPEVAFVVTVNHPQMGSYQAQTNSVVQHIAMPRVQPGATVQVRVNPQNPQDIAVVV